MEIAERVAEGVEPYCVAACPASTRVRRLERSGERAEQAVAKAKSAAVRPIRWAGGLVAVGLMVVTGLAYYQSLGLPAWSGAATVPLFLVGDLALGAGLCVLATAGVVLARYAFFAAGMM